MFVIVRFVYVHMKCSRSRILLPFSRGVALSKITPLLFATAFASCYSISINLRYASTIVYTFVTCYTSNYIFVKSCSSYATTLSSLASFCTVCASTI
jgi:predicted small integral membrane protein